MVNLPAGPPLLVHIMIVCMVNALCFPMFYRWSGSILYAFLISVGVLSVYGVIANRLFRNRKR